MFLMILINPKSIRPRKNEITNTRPMTTAVEARSSLRVGHFTFLSSVRDSLRNWREIAPSWIPTSRCPPSFRRLFWRAREAFFSSSPSRAGRLPPMEIPSEPPRDRTQPFPSLSLFSRLFIVPALSLSSVQRHRLWQARRDSNPHHPDLESGALAVRATGLHARNLLRLLVERVGFAEGTVFLERQLVRCLSFVFCRRIIPVLALLTS